MLLPACRPVAARALLTLGLGLGLAACAGPRVRTPPAPPPTAACKVLDPTATASALPPGVQAQRQGLNAAGTVSSGPNLRRLVPGQGPPGQAPLPLAQLLSLRGEPSEAQWRALAPTADVELAAHAEDAEADPVLRARALAGLAVRRAVNAEPLMIRLLADAGTDAAVRRAAARALAVGDLRADGPALIALTAALAAPEVRLRETTARALAPHRGAVAVAAVFEARARVETVPEVRAVLAGDVLGATAEPGGAAVVPPDAPPVEPPANPADGDTPAPGPSPGPSPPEDAP